MFTVVLSGDPKRKPLFERLRRLYSNYASVDNVLLYYERSPAVSFNKGARASKSSHIFFTCDCYVAEEVMKRMVALCNGSVAYLQLHKKRSGLWDIGIRAFTSGAFAVKRENILAYPISETEDLCEEILWLHSCPLQFVPFFTSHANFVHLDKHMLKHDIVGSIRTTQCRARLKKRGRIRHFYFFIDLYVGFTTWLKQLRKLHPHLQLSHIMVNLNKEKK